MLYADKAALENRTKVKLLSIRERAQRCSEFFSRSLFVPWLRI